MPGGKIIFRRAVSGGSRSALTIDDLAWQGHAKFPTEGDASTDAGSNFEGYGAGLAVRYAYNRDVSPAVERLYLIANVSYVNGDSSGANTRVGDLVEYKAPALTTGAIASANTMVEVRRWHAAEWFPKTTDATWSPLAGWLGGMYWQPDLTDANGGVLWITTWGEYNGPEGYKQIYAVKLSNTIVTGNYATVVQRYGPWYWNSSGLTASWKEVTLGMTSIPSYAQSALGNRKYAFQGTYTSVSGLPYLQYGPNLRGIPDFPTLATSSPWNDGDVITRGNAIMTHAFDDASPFGNAKVPGTVTDLGSVEQLFYQVYQGGVYYPYSYNSNSPIDTGTSVNDAIYINTDKYNETGTNSWVYMSTPAVGGTRVVEYSKGSGVWGTLSGSWSHGGSDLSSNKNNFVYASTPGDWATDTVNGYGPVKWIRIRITSAPSSGGYIKNAGSCIPISGVSYSGENWYPAGDIHTGLVWVYTDTKHGLITFARRTRGNAWYGEKHGFNGSTEIAVADDFSETFVQTGHGFRFQFIDPAFYIYDPAQVIAAAGNGTRDNIGPPTVDDWTAQWPNIPYRYAITDSADVRYLDVFQANATFYDATTNQLLWAPPHVSAAEYGAPVLEVFQVS